MAKSKKSRTVTILQVMQVVTWIVYIGLSIEAGGIMVSFFVSLFNFQAAEDLHLGLGLKHLLDFDQRHYIAYVSLLIAVPVLKASLMYRLIQVLSKVKLESPFTLDVAKILEKMSMTLFGIWIVSLIGHSYANWLTKKTPESFSFEVLDEYLLIAGLVFILSQVFRRGVEIQVENDLTV